MNKLKEVHNFNIILLTLVLNCEIWLCLFTKQKQISYNERLERKSYVLQVYTNSWAPQQQWSK